MQKYDAEQIEKIIDNNEKKNETVEAIKKRKTQKQLYNIELTNLKQQATFEVYNFLEINANFNIETEKATAIDEIIKNLLQFNYFSADDEIKQKQILYVTNFLNYNFFTIYNRHKREKQASIEQAEPTAEALHNLIKELDKSWL